MRVYPYYILNSHEPEKFPPGSIVFDTRINSHHAKGKVSKLKLVDESTGQLTYPCAVIGLGYKDFKDDADLNANGYNRCLATMDYLGIEKFRGEDAQ